MADGPLTPERILEASEDVLRRFGPAKATVVDVARELGVSHGSVYRHFPSKAALRDAVAERWLAAVSEPLAASQPRTAPRRSDCGAGSTSSIASKRAAPATTPSCLQPTSRSPASRDRSITAHVIRSRPARADHRRRRRAASLRRDRPTAAGRAVFDATARFHNPANSAFWTDPRIAADYEHVTSLVLAGLSART